MDGIICWFNLEKGFGEILSDDGVSFFFQYNSVVTKMKPAALKAGTRVKFQTHDRLVFGRKVAKQINEVKAMRTSNISSDRKRPQVRL